MGEEASAKGSEARKIVSLEGPLFFTYANKLSKVLKPETDPNIVEVRLSSTVVTAMDFTGIHVLQQAAAGYKEQGKQFIVYAVEPNEERLLVLEELEASPDKSLVQVYGNVPIEAY